MNLTKQQLDHFDKEGYLFFPKLFSEKETECLVSAVPELYQRKE